MDNAMANHRGPYAKTKTPTDAEWREGVRKGRRVEMRNALLKAERELNALGDSMDALGKSCRIVARALTRFEGWDDEYSMHAEMERFRSTAVRVRHRQLDALEEELMEAVQAPLGIARRSGLIEGFDHRVHPIDRGNRVHTAAMTIWGKRMAEIARRKRIADFNRQIRSRAAFNRMAEDVRLAIIDRDQRLMDQGKCPLCAGDGLVSQGKIGDPCPTCAGSGFTYGGGWGGGKCFICGGKGRVGVHSGAE